VEGDGLVEVLAPWHLALILLGFLLLFGYKRLPDASRSLGRSLRIFKAEMSELSPGPTTAAEAAEPVASPATASVPSVEELESPSVEELERRAQQAEAEAEALRAQARGRTAGS
jgi:sec-independent protein translocase protein TatA